MRRGAGNVLCNGNRLRRWFIRPVSKNLPQLPLGQNRLHAQSSKAAAPLAGEGEPSIRETTAHLANQDHKEQGEKEPSNSSVLQTLNLPLDTKNKLIIIVLILFPEGLAR